MTTSDARANGEAMNEELIPVDSIRITRAATDLELIEAWLEAVASRSEATRRAYRRNVGLWIAALEATDLRRARVEDLQSFARSLEACGYALESRKQILASVKSLHSFACKTGYCRFNIGTAVALAASPDTLPLRVLDYDYIVLMIASEPRDRNRLLLRTLYVTGARVSEICRLKWQDLRPQDDFGNCTLFGKRGQTRTVKIPARLWRDLEAARGPDSAAVFTSRRGGHLDPASVWRIVRRAASRIQTNSGRTVSPHDLRHSHASHALAAGAPITVIQDTLGHKELTTTRRYAKHIRRESSGDWLEPI